MMTLRCRVVDAAWTPVTEWQCVRFATKANVMTNIDAIEVPSGTIAGVEVEAFGVVAFPDGPHGALASGSASVDPGGLALKATLSDS